jgi:uncharacterized protein YrzB (UPF0473 family)
METNKRFAVFILSHGRADIITTVDTLRKQGYTGEIFVVIDDEDDQEDLYREKFGDAVIQFNKMQYFLSTDTGDLDQSRTVGVFARNFIQDEAKRRGYKYHLQLDDDVTMFDLRWENEEGKLKFKKCMNMDKMIEAMCDFMDCSPKITALSFGCTGYLIGGAANQTWKDKLVRKAMTTFFLRSDDVNYFSFRMNDDITTTALNTMKGKLYFTTAEIEAHTAPTQSIKGGMTEAYLDSGTYRKSFYSVMALPAAAVISAMGETDYRIHHAIYWGKCAPKILSDRWKK